MSLARVQQFSISLDGFGTGEPQSRDAHFGHAGERLHEWMFATRWWGEMVGQPGGTGGIDDAFSQQFAPGIGAEIMGAGKFGHPGWHEDPEWKGAWGPNPPFHTPVFVLTHHPRPAMGGGAGVPPRLSTHRSSSSPITRAPRSRWRAARRSTSSTLRPPRRSRQPARLRTARTYASAAVPP